MMDWFCLGHFTLWGRTDVKKLAWLIFGLFGVAGCDYTPLGMPSMPADLRPAGDLAGADLSAPSYKATLPTCTPVTVTAGQVYSGVVSGSCISCHKTTAPKMATAQDLVNNLVGKMPRAAQMPLVTSGDPNKSYLIFRLTGEGDLITGGSSGWMPSGSAKLGQSAMCLWVNWVRSGAPP